MWDVTCSHAHSPLHYTVSIIKVAPQGIGVPKIDVSEYVKTEMDELKEAEEHKSYDSVIRTLLGEYDR